MSERLWIRSHVELLLQREWDSTQVRVDDEGDYPFRAGTAACWVAVLDSQPVMVRVFAHAAYGFKRSLALLREINDVQSRALSSRIDLVDGRIVVSQTISPIGLTQPVLAQAMHQVARVADDIGLLLAACYGGTTPFPADLDGSHGVA